jgi:hypothetical protein
MNMLSGLHASSPAMLRLMRLRSLRVNGATAGTKYMFACPDSCSSWEVFGMSKLTTGTPSLLRTVRLIASFVPVSALTNGSSPSTVVIMNSSRVKAAPTHWPTLRSGRRALPSLGSVLNRLVMSVSAARGKIAPSTVSPQTMKCCGAHLFGSEDQHADG